MRVSEREEGRRERWREGGRQRRRDRETYTQKARKNRKTERRIQNRGDRAKSLKRGKEIPMNDNTPLNCRTDAAHCLATRRFLWLSLGG